jgi:hypothetical protein
MKSYDISRHTNRILTRILRGRIRLVPYWRHSCAHLVLYIHLAMNYIVLSYLRMGFNVGFCVKDIEQCLIPELHDWSNEHYRLRYIKHSTKSQHPVTLNIYWYKLTFQTTNWHTYVAFDLALEATQLWSKWEWIMDLEAVPLPRSSRPVNSSEGYLTTLQMLWRINS